MYFLDEVKKIATIESFQDDFFVDLHIPSSINGFVVKQICSRAFRRNKNLQTITLPDSITCINAEAFNECYSLEKVHFYSSSNKTRCLNIGYRAFASCAKLIQITSDMSICTNCDKDAFYNCIRLQNINLLLQNLENNCFENCFVLNDIVFAENALWKTCTFKGCSILKNITFMGDVEELLSDTCMKWISKRKIKCKKNTSIADFVYAGSYIEFI